MSIRARALPRWGALLKRDARMPTLQMEQRERKTPMRQIPEVLQTEPLNSALSAAENASDDEATNTMVCVYGHGPTKNPFYEEARAISTSAAGALLILSAAVSRGQTLLLLNGT